jgi:hypothetical protein
MERSKALGKPTNHRKATFWNLFHDCETQAFEKFQRPDQVSSLAAAMKQLTAYHDLVKEAGWHGEEALIKDEMKKLIRRQFGVLFEKAASSEQYPFDPTAASASIEITWNSLPPGGWESIFRSILMVANERVCYENFGREIVWLENFLRFTRKQIENDAWGISPSTKHCLLCKQSTSLSFQRAVLYCSSCNKFFNTKENKGNCGYCKHKTAYDRPLEPNGRCNNCWQTNTQDYQEPCLEYLKILYVDGRLEPVDPAAYTRNVGVDIPEDGPSDPAHYGHLLWHFYRFMKAVDKN